MTIEQGSGLAWTTGFPEREPVVPRGICDPVGGMTAVFALLLALEMRRKGAGGQQVEVPLIEVGLTLAGEQVVEQSAYGVRLEREGNRGPLAAPQGVYAARDPRPEDGQGAIVIAVQDDAQWAALVDAMGRPEWAAQPAYRTEAGRRAAADAIDVGLADFCRDRDARELADDLCALGIPAGAMHNIRNVAPGHPQLDARGYLAFHEHPYAGRIGYPHLGMRFGGAYPERTLPPTLGEHNDEVLREVLGLSEEEVERLREQAVIGTRPSFL